MPLRLQFTGLRTDECLGQHTGPYWGVPQILHMYITRSGSQEVRGERGGWDEALKGIFQERVADGF